jgi:hypothetical protein
LQLVRHRGAKVRQDSDDFTFDDLTRSSPEHPLTGHGHAEATWKRSGRDLPAVVALVNRWMGATS